MKKVLAVIGCVFVLASCTFVEPEFRGGESIQVGKIDGRDIQITAGAKIYNPNGYGIKIKPSTLDVYAGEEYIGKVHLDKKFKMKAKQETSIEAPMTATLAEGAMFRAIKLLNSDKITLRLSGKVKAGVLFVSKKFDVNETRTLDGLDLGLNFQ